MTEAQEVATAFTAGAAGFPALLWLVHKAERRIHNGWEKTLENMAMTADPPDWALAERYIREGTPPETTAEKAQDISTDGKVETRPSKRRPKCRNSTWNGTLTPKSPT